MKIFSYENSLHEEFAKSFQEAKPIHSRFGLKSVSDILNMHKIDLDLSNITGLGLCISLNIPKYQDLDSKETTLQDEAQVSKQILSKSLFRNLLLLILVIILFLSPKIFVARNSAIFQKTLNHERLINPSAFERLIELKRQI